MPAVRLLFRSKSGLTAELLQLAWPLIVSNLAYVLLGIVDTVYMGRVGAVEVGAVGLASNAVLTLMLLFRGTLETLPIFGARALGAGDPAGFRRWYSVYLALALLLGTVLALSGPSLLQALLRLLGTDPQVVGPVLIYGTIRMYEAPLHLLATVNGQAFVSSGDTRTPMRIAWAMVLLNALLAYLFVFGLGWGIAGAGWATFLAVAFQAGLSQVLLWRRFGPLLPGLPRRAELLKIVTVGVPVGLSTLAISAAFTTFNGLISRLGPLELAASQIAQQLAAFGFMPAFALSVAASTLVARALGERRPDRARRIGWRGAGVAAVLMGLLGLLFWTVPVPLLSLFTDRQEVWPLGSQVLRIMAIYQVMDAVAIVLGGTLAGAGDTRFRLMISLLGSWGVMVLPASYLLSHGYGLTAAWTAALVYIAFAALAFGGRFWSGRWLRYGAAL
ncbi:MATE family multidrug resistance protein [Deinobacterium chartae]|uniref:Multidrug-efflux transporter n=1 Tax=Deinobacterium chartae TaxID=521158 RepID=A0A841HZQ8_9DEIO|nr:MATE family multidrug resistance protein [Deinobacterium chartae]